MEESHPLLSLLSASFSVIFWILQWARTLIAFATITIPTWIYAILSYSFTLRLDFYSLLVLFVLSGISLSLLMRHRYLNKYTLLKEAPLHQPDMEELHPDVQAAAESPQPFHNYLDEFLLAIRVFGFLEKPVFHELARHLQTRRLIAGDTLSLDQDKNFYCVVDGLVQVYAQTSSPSEDSDNSWVDDELNGYQLLNEVGSGGTLSSLFTILSLFTENVTLAWPDEEAEDTPSSLRPEFLSRSSVDSDVSQLSLESERPTFPFTIGRGRSASDVSSEGSGTNSTRTARLPANLDGGLRTPGSNTSRPHMARASSSQTSFSMPPSPSRTQQSSATGRPPLASRRTTLPSGLEGAIARATVDTTLAVIPAVILTRFSRVTFNVADRYLGLTSELLRTEKAINDLACHPLPAEFYRGGGMQQLRQRFAPEPRSAGPTDDTDAETDYFSLSHEGSSNGTAKRQSSKEEAHSESSVSSSSKELKTPRAIRHLTTSPSITGPPSNIIPTRSSSAKTSERTSPSIFRHRSHVQAGDLHSMTGGGNNSNETYRPWTNRSFSTLFTPRTGSGSSQAGENHSVFDLGSTEAQHYQHHESGNLTEFDLRDEVMDCLARSIGLIQPPISGAESPAEVSPSFGPLSSMSMKSGSTRTGGGSSKLPFMSSFSSLSLLETADDASSITGGTSAMGGRGEPDVENEVEILFFGGGDTLVKAGERNAGLFFVIEGFLDVSLPINDDSTLGKHKEPEALPLFTPGPRKHSLHDSVHPQQKAQKSKHLFTVKAGGIAGYFSSLTGIPSYVDIRAKTDVYVGFLPHNALERLLEKRPIVLLTLAKRLISLLSPLVLQIDSALDWQQVNAGQVLWRPREPSDSFYIVINGRLRDLADEEEEGSVKILKEYGQGDTVGELDVITSSPRSTTLHAIRDTELVRMPLTLFNAISAQHPKTTGQLLRMVATRVRENAQTKPTTKTGSNLNLKTVAVIPTTKNVPVAAFAKTLQAALENNGAPTSYLTQASVTSHLGRHAFTKMGKLKVAGWLADQEQRYRIVLYVADSPVGAQWTQTCIRQADSVLLVGMGDDPNIGEYERLLLSIKTTARKELVLLHPERYVIPGSTREWLKLRPWVHAHFHVEMPGIIVPKPAPVLVDPAAVKAFKKLKTTVQDNFNKYRGSPKSTPTPQRPHNSNDFARLARRLCGKSIGLVLGGGGARGISHLGVIQALEERGVPIDQIGGTSIGSFVSGLYAREGDLISSVGRAKQFSGRMGNIWRILSDVTYPIVAYTTGHEFNRAIYKAFYDLHIEDMWLPFYCNTTNILTSKNEVHTSGYAWRYIRASMTLVGLLPPLCDNGNVLVDGGYVDNLPVSTMVSQGASAVFAVDVGAVDDTTPRNFGDTVSGWWLLLQRLNPFAANHNIPPITEIQSRLAYVSSVKTLADAKVMAGCWYMPIPVQEYGTLQFNKFEPILEIGYQTGIKMLAEWEAAGNLPSGYEEGFQGPDRKKKGKSLRRNSI